MARKYHIGFEGGAYRIVSVDGPEFTCVNTCCDSGPFVVHISNFSRAVINNRAGCGACINRLSGVWSHSTMVEEVHKVMQLGEEITVRDMIGVLVKSGMIERDCSRSQVHAALQELLDNNLVTKNKIKKLNIWRITKRLPSMADPMPMVMKMIGVWRDNFGELR